MRKSHFSHLISLLYRVNNQRGFVLGAKLYKKRLVEFYLPCNVSDINLLRILTPKFCSSDAFFK